MDTENNDAPPGAAAHFLKCAWDLVAYFATMMAVTYLVWSLRGHLDEIGRVVISSFISFFVSMPFFAYALYIGSKGKFPFPLLEAVARGLMIRLRELGARDRFVFLFYFLLILVIAISTIIGPFLIEPSSYPAAGIVFFFSTILGKSALLFVRDFPTE